MANTRFKVALAAAAVAVAAALVQGAAADAAFTADFREGLPGWKVHNGATTATVEKFKGENALVIRRDASAKKKGTEWCVVGEEFAGAAKALKITSAEVQSFPDIESLKAYVTENPLEGCTILIKGSNGKHMTRVVDAL